MTVTTFILRGCLLLGSIGVQGASSSGRMSFYPAESPLLYFGTDDALEVIWYHAANSLAEMQEALDGDYMMLEGDIILEWSGFPNQTDIPIMAHPPAVTSDNTFENWIQNVLTHAEKAPKLDFKKEDVMEPALVILQSKAALVNCPVWANADIVKGPGTVKQPIDSDMFFQLVNTYFPNMTLSLGWTTGCCHFNFTMEMMEEMWAKVENIPQPASFSARAALLKASWEEFRWLLLKDTTRFSLTVWTPAGEDDWEGASIYDMLYVRNDVDKKLIYYDLPGQKLEDFKNLAVTGGSPLNHFDELQESRDAMGTTWAHSVNSQAELDEAIQSSDMMLEADVLLQGQGTPNQTDVPIMAHPPDIYSDITLEEWLNSVIQTDKGMKLDFKYTEVLEPAMQILKKKKSPFLYRQPVWINSDIFRGPNSADSNPVDAEEFKRIVLEHFPECTLSIGWTTKWPGPEGYTEDMVSQMRQYLVGVEQPITFPIRASLVRRSWSVLGPLLEESRAYTMTIWSNSDIVDPDDLVYVRENSDPEKIYYDLPPWLMTAFLNRLNETDSSESTTIGKTTIAKADETSGVSELASPYLVILKVAFILRLIVFYRL